MIVDFLKQKIHEISQTFDVLCIECDKDHHMIFKAKPILNLPKLNAIKTITSREKENFRR